MGWSGLPVTEKADLVIMGITGKSAIAQVFIWQQYLKMAATKACR